jgi:hypothetical protein
MDEFGGEARARAAGDVGFADGGTMDAAPAVAVATVPSGRIERRQQREGGRLCQTVEIRRRDGSVWTAYARQLALPADPGEADRATEQATHVLALLAAALAAADTAREARGQMLEWAPARPPWTASYG